MIFLIIRPLIKIAIFGLVGLMAINFIDPTIVNELITSIKAEIPFYRFIRNTVLIGYM